MHFNRYIFDLYLQSPKGKESLKIWSDFLDWQNFQTSKKPFSKLLFTVKF